MNSEQHRTPLHVEKFPLSVFRQLNWLNLTPYSATLSSNYDLPHSFARVSSNNMVINLDPPQQKTSHQQAHKYNDRCPLQPANLSLGSTHFVALLIKRAAMGKKLMKPPHVNSMSPPWRRQASFQLANSGIVVWDLLFNREKQDAVCVSPFLIPQV